MLLELRDIAVNYGQVSALRHLTMSVPDGAIVTIIGGNGAGKTTTLRAVSGLAKLATGEILFEGERIDILPADINAPATDAEGLGEAIAGAKPPAPIERRSIFADVDPAVWRRAFARQVSDEPVDELRGNQ